MPFVVLPLDINVQEGIRLAIDKWFFQVKNIQEFWSFLKKKRVEFEQKHANKDNHNNTNWFWMSTITTSSMP